MSAEPSFSRYGGSVIASRIARISASAPTASCPPSRAGTTLLRDFRAQLDQQKRS